MRRPTETEITHRMAIWGFVAAGVGIALYEPVHTWLHAHLELLLGFLLGTLAQTVPWLIDRWRWMKWFSL